MPVFSSVLDLIGNTPLVDVSALSPNPDVRILAKLEGENPGGSVKDRIALAMVEDAEKEGLLAPGSTLIEPSSGNTGIGMALVCRIKGYKLKVVLPGQRVDRAATVARALGRRRHRLPAGGRLQRRRPPGAGDLGSHPEWTFLYQYANPANPRAHYETTGPEIWRDCPEITHFVAGLGTSGTLLGVGRFLKEPNPEVQVWAVEPPTGEMVEGLRNLDEGYIPPIFLDQNGADLLDRKTIVGPKDSIEWTRRLTDLGVFAGISSGAALAGAVKCAAQSSGGPSSSSPPTGDGSTCRPGPGPTTSTSLSNGRGGSSTSDRHVVLLRACRCRSTSGRRSSLGASYFGGVTDSQLDTCRPSTP